jgi:hypothetical protein
VADADDGEDARVRLKEPRSRKAAPQPRGRSSASSSMAATAVTAAIGASLSMLERGQEFAYRATPHHRAASASRQGHWLSESMFVRFAIDRIEGDLERYLRLVALMESLERHPRGVQC